MLVLKLAVVELVSELLLEVVLDLVLVLAALEWVLVLVLELGVPVFLRTLGGPQPYRLQS